MYAYNLLRIAETQRECFVLVDSISVVDIKNPTIAKLDNVWSWEVLYSHFMFLGKY